MNQRNNAYQWGTADEIRVIDYIASGEKRERTGYIPTKQQRVNGLKAWIKESYGRKWGKKIDVEKCRQKAKAWIVFLEVKIAETGVNL